MAVDMEEVRLGNEHRDGTGVILATAAGGDLLGYQASLPADIKKVGSVIDDNNTSFTPLGIDEVFTGTATDLLGYSTVDISLHSNVDSAINGMTFQFSPDSTNWDDVNTFELDASESNTRRFQFPITARYFRVVYTNGGTGQTAFRLQTVLHTASQLTSVHRLKDTVHDDRSVTVVKSVIFAQQAGGTDDFVAVQATNSGNFKVSLEEVNGNIKVDTDTDAGEDFRHGVALLVSEDGGAVQIGSANPMPVQDPLLEISETKVIGHFPVNKYGRSTNVDASLTDIWDGANSVDNTKIWIAPTQARVHNVKSSDVGDTGGGAGARTLQIWGLTDWNTPEATQVITMDGQNNVATNPYVIIHRMRVLTKGATSINIGKITATAVSDGTITAMILAGTGNTEMAIYGVPSTQKLFVYDFYAAMLRSSPASARFDFSLLYNPGPDTELLHFQIRHTDALDSTGTTSKNTPYVPPKVFAGPGILKLQGIASVADLDISAGFNGVVITT